MLPASIIFIGMEVDGILLTVPENHTPRPREWGKKKNMSIFMFINSFIEAFHVKQLLKSYSSVLER